MNLRFKLYRWMIEADRFILPPLCPFCRTPLKRRERALCGPCREDLPWNTPCCPRCALPLGTADGGERECAACQARPPAFRRVLAPFRFEFPVDAGIRAIKFNRRLEFVPVFAHAMAMAMARSYSPEEQPGLLVPVPLHYLRHGLRGFNQADLLASRIARIRDIPVCRKVARIRSTRPQTGLDTRARRDNLDGAFRAGTFVRGRHVLIVDDVMTTGATVKELGGCLERAGAASVSVIVAARRVLA